jgi:hypothetical protein
MGCDDPSRGTNAIQTFTAMNLDSPATFRQSTSVGCQVSQHCWWLLCLLLWGSSGCKESRHGPLSYALTTRNGDTEVMITMCERDAKEVEIPSNLDGYPVTQIWDGAFNACTQLTQITIPEGVVRVGEGAFMACPSLKSIAFPQTTTSIGGAAFMNCSRLEAVTIPNLEVHLGPETFRGCHALKQVRVAQRYHAKSELHRLGLKGRFAEVFESPRSIPQ